jgi:hypothetical protein
LEKKTGLKGTQSKEVKMSGKLAVIVAGPLAVRVVDDLVKRVIVVMLKHGLETDPPGNVHPDEVVWLGTVPTENVHPDEDVWLGSGPGGEGMPARTI